jgi:hypothetical protein
MRVLGITGVELQSDDPVALAEKWATLYGLEVGGSGLCPSLDIENARLSFVRATDGRGEGLSAVAVSVVDASVILATANNLGLAVNADRAAVDICGVRFDLVPHAVQVASSSRG